MQTAREPPSLLWGLDPVFSAFARLYIRDVLEMSESTQVPGVYFFNSRPIYKVHVLGTVVSRREREDFFCYGVDDGSGVIACLCWKSDLMKEQLEPSTGGRQSDAAAGGFDPAAELRKLKQAQEEQSRLEIGELLRVRGAVKTSRGQREIMASCFYKVSDPVMSVQLSWMSELPLLYKQVYERPLELKDHRDVSLLTRATDAVRVFLEDKPAVTFRPYDVQDLLLPLVSTRTPAEQEPAPGPSVCSQVSALLKQTLKVLQEEGLVYRKVLSQDQVYCVTLKDLDLTMAVRDIVREDCQRDKYAEKGVHLLHILSAVRRRYSPNVSKAALEKVLSSLECSSDVISSGNNYYLAFVM
ncbi:CST complex subunit STN1 [Synchiropus splendidus]|uniref:CST complex subunit STN1 n=1 Tax=Synchiropus splendidus TaxID=270530 RepID=UPI00237E8198|nr:CST complex subunit STN1 [Synchiropus splendidus]